MRLGAGVAWRRVRVRSRERLGEFGDVGADREVGAVDAVEFGRVGMDVDQRLARMVGRDQRVAVGRRLAEPRADTSSRSAALIRATSFGLGP